MATFGKYAVVIPNMVGVAEKILHSMGAVLGKEVYFGPVVYYEKEKMGAVQPWGPFCKEARFKNQNECRFFFSDTAEGPKEVDIGLSLREYAFPVQTDVIIQGLFIDNKGRLYTY